MPFQAPQSLSNDQVYAVVGYILSQNKLMSPDAKVDAKTEYAAPRPASPLASLPGCPANIGADLKERHDAGL